MTKQWILAGLPGTGDDATPDGTPIYRVFVRDLVVACSIGAHDFEKVKRQRVRINAELRIAMPSPGSDQLGEVVNYGRIVAGIRALAAAGHVHLVETLADRLAALCLADERVLSVRIGVEKLDVYPDAESVGVVIERRRAAVARTTR
jgi:dihydroneopterin aldolase